MATIVISDMHLNFERFPAVAKFMKKGGADRVVCLMDMPDDWGKEKDIDLYRKTFDAAIEFAKMFPDTLWCYGNHELSYLWHRSQGGYSTYAADIVREKLWELRTTLPEDNPIQYVHRVDDVLFSHGGLTRWFVEEHVPPEKYNDIDYVVNAINALGPAAMWDDDISPIWYRHPMLHLEPYMEEKCLQVVGHHPVEQITKEGSILLCDVFSTKSDGKTAIGNKEYLLLDTKTKSYKGIRL